MAVATFDTLKFANTLKAAGVPDKQAEAQAAAFAEILQVNFKELATRDDLERLGKATKEDLERAAKAAKADLDQAVKEVRHDIKDLREELKRDIKDESQKLQTQYVRLAGDMLLLKWMFGAMMTLMTGILIRLFFYPIR